MTIAQPDTGALRPTLIIGVGAFGRKALLELRCRFLDRFGDLNKLSLLRFLCIDSDPEALNTAIRGAPEVALTRNEVYPLPLQPVVNYRRRSLEELSEWLPREKLYAMPRSLQTQGSRALGRLAFSDNQQRLVARLRREIQEVTNPDNIYQSVSLTGLALRDTTPRVYVIAAAGGGGSGLLPDLGYALRRLLAQLRHPDSKINAFLLCGAPQDPATPKQEQANIYATLTELNHFCDANIRFAAQYGVDGQRIVDEGSPFTSVYLLPQPHRTPEAVETTLAHLGNYLFHELTTPLGLRLENLRHGEDVSGSDGPPPVCWRHPCEVLAPTRFGFRAACFCGWRRGRHVSALSRVGWPPPKMKYPSRRKNRFKSFSTPLPSINSSNQAFSPNASKTWRRQARLPTLATHRARSWQASWPSSKNRSSNPWPRRTLETGPNRP